MNQDVPDPKFRDLLPTLRAYYAYLKCGRHILKEVFLWTQKLQDIPDVEKYILTECGITNVEYRKYFTATTREIFKNNGISKVDITALWRMHYTVNKFFRDTVQPWSQVEDLLNKIKHERNDIMHTLLMEDKIQDEKQLRDYLKGISDEVDKIIQAFHDQFGGYATEQQRMDLREFVKNILDEVRKQINVDNIDIQHHGEGNIDFAQNVTTHGMDNNDAEDVATDLFQKIFGVAGQKGSLSIQHHGTGDINVTQEVYNISGGSHTFTI